MLLKHKLMSQIYKYYVVNHAFEFNFSPNLREYF